MNPTFNNDQWLKRAFITIAEAPRVDTSLPAPYGHTVAPECVPALIAALRPRVYDARLQMASARKVPLRKGWKVVVWMLAFRPGYCGDHRGVTEEEWSTLACAVADIIRAHVPDASIYCEPWSADSKFQFRWEAHLLTNPHPI